MDYTEPERRSGSDNRRSGTDRRETLPFALSGVDFERRMSAWDRRQGKSRRRTDLIPLNTLEQMR